MSNFHLLVLIGPQDALALFCLRLALRHELFGDAVPGIGIGNPGVAAYRRPAKDRIVDFVGHCHVLADEGRRYVVFVGGISQEILHRRLHVNSLYQVFLIRHLDGMLRLTIEEIYIRPIDLSH